MSSSGVVLEEDAYRLVTESFSQMKNTGYRERQVEDEDGGQRWWRGQEEAVDRSACRAVIP